MSVVKKLIFVFPFTMVLQCLAQSNDTQKQIVGSWRGHSTCMIKTSPCHDEINVYRIEKISDQPYRVSVTGSKIVDGKAIVMGTGEWKYDAQKHVLESLDGRFRLTMNGNKLEGALTIDGAVYRQIYLEKEKEDAPVKAAP